MSGRRRLQAALAIQCLAFAAACAGKPPAGKEYEFARRKGATDLAVWVVSSRAGLVFTDGEPLDLHVRLSGAPAEATVEYVAVQHDGQWRKQGALTFAKARQDRPLPLKLPGRGLYRLDLTARCGQATARASTSVAVLFEPDPPSEASPWGIFYIRPLGAKAAESLALQDAVANMRQLGASWVRLNFWAFAYGKVTVADGKATADCEYYRRIVREMRRQGLFIMGEFAQVPRVLSSRPDDTRHSGDAGPMWCRVKPKDYRLWDSMVERMAREFAGDIDVWEIANEPDLRGKYWAGTVEEYIEHVHHSAAAVKRGNPKARIAVGGFTGVNDFSRKVLAACGKDIDILSFHYSDARGHARRWKQLLGELKLDRPMWNTEEREEVPVRDLSCGVERVFKFIHLRIGYDGYRPLMNLDLTARPAGVLYAVGAKCIGDGKSDGYARQGGCEAFYVRRGGERVGVFDGAPREVKLFGGLAAAVKVKAEPLRKGSPVAVIDMWGRSRPVELRDGVGQFDWTTEMMYVRGARSLELIEAEAAARTEGAHVFEAEKGKWSAGWGVMRHKGFSEGRTVDIYADGEPPKDGYWVELKLLLPAAGRYQILFSGNSLARLTEPRSLSPFVWSMDGGEQRHARGDVEVIKGVPGAPQGLSVLGEADLTAGEHTFRLRLTGRRQRPDTRYALWIDAIALRPKAEER